SRRTSRSTHKSSPRAMEEKRRKPRTRKRFAPQPRAGLVFRRVQVVPDRNVVVPWWNGARPDASALGQVAGLLGADEQLVLGVDEGFPLVVRELVFLLEVDRVLRTGLLAHAAEDAAQHVDLVAPRVTLAVGARSFRIVLRRLDVDRVG